MLFEVLQFVLGRYHCDCVEIKLPERLAMLRVITFLMAAI